MSKVAILSVGDYKHITLISKYVLFFNQHRIDYTVLCTNRYNDNIERKNVCRYKFSDGKTKLEKVKNFLNFHSWAKKHILNNKYDFIVVWNENTALLFADLLLINYRKRYCVNIRDIDFLNQYFFNIIRSFVIRQSRFSTYCSTAKLDFPKSYHYLLMRSVNLGVLKHVPKRYHLQDVTKPIKIAFVGKIRFMDANEEIISAFGNDNRYELWFIGAGSEKLEKYLLKYHNLHLVGAYEPEETAKYLMDIDVINSYFGTKVLGFERMSSIRFSYAPYIHIPVIVGTNTNMEEEGTKYGFAYGFGKHQINEEANYFFKWYRKINVKDFINGCERYCSDVSKSETEFYSALKACFSECYDE